MVHYVFLSVWLCCYWQSQFLNIITFDHWHYFFLVGRCQP
ncbi:hypothetical protein COK_2165 [Mannheimia haemolytica serotype A2 str. BOVINE]|nr:hypothetical protein COK_2165 [Mannheimia haemolytica serotype A2 str. BOVINE]